MAFLVTVSPRPNSSSSFCCQLPKEKMRGEQPETQRASKSTNERTENGFGLFKEGMMKLFSCPLHGDFFGSSPLSVRPRPSFQFSSPIICRVIANYIRLGFWLFALDVVVVTSMLINGVFSEFLAFCSAATFSRSKVTPLAQYLLRHYVQGKHLGRSV